MGCNTFTYCLNSPVNYTDVAGTDAVWIQEWNSAEGQGHTGLMVQDADGNWFYFFWGPEPEEEAASDVWKLTMGVPNGAYYVQYVPDGSVQPDLRDTEAVIAAVNEMFGADNTRNRSALITDTIYLEGDYQNTHAYLESLFDKAGICSEKYYLIGNNCVQKSMYALYLSDPRFLPLNIVPIPGRIRPLVIPAVHPNAEYIAVKMRLAW